MGLVLKHVVRTKSGSFQYRRRVPKNVSAIITKREFKRKLGDSEREALAAYPRFHAQVEREIANARARIESARESASPDITERAAYEEARRRRRDMLEMGISEEDLAFGGETWLDSLPIDARGEPVAASPVDHHTINLLRLGPERWKAPEPTLGDALRLYLSERVDASGPDADNRPANLARRVIAFATEALNIDRPGRGDPPLSSISREDARYIRDHMLDRVKLTGRGIGEKVSPSTVERELSIIAAVVNHAKAEFGLPDTFSNPFNKLTVPKAAKGRGQRAADKRLPLPPDVLKEARERVLANAGPALGWVWRLLEGTGCRLAEVTGLMVEDVKTDAEFPHIRIDANEVRNLKTEASSRVVPLVGDALEAAKEALKVAGGTGPLFPQYGRRRGSDAASAALMKHIRKASQDPKHVVHSLRHNMKDRLVVAEVQSLDQNLILGHAVAGVGDRVYGGESAKLRATTRAMVKALGVGG